MKVYCDNCECIVNGVRVSGVEYYDIDMKKDVTLENLNCPFCEDIIIPNIKKEEESKYFNDF
jgi:hypothetical protein